MKRKDIDVCEKCFDCIWYWQNRDDENECNGEEKPCHEFIAKENDYDRE